MKVVTKKTDDARGRRDGKFHHLQAYTHSKTCQGCFGWPLVFVRTRWVREKEKGNEPLVLEERKTEHAKDEEEEERRVRLRVREKGRKEKKVDERNEY